MSWGLRNNWEDLAEICPISLDSIRSNASDFNRLISKKLIRDDQEKVKEDLMRARGELDLIITKIISLLYDTNILKTDIDKALFAILKDDLSRYIKRLDEQEEKLLITFDERGGARYLGTSRLSAFAKILMITMEILYSSLKSASLEYISFKGTDEIKKDRSLFFKILFQILSISMSVHGGIPREKSVGIGQSKGSFGAVPTTWRAMFTNEGKERIRDQFKERFGEDMPSAPELEEYEDEEEERDDEDYN